MFYKCKNVTGTWTTTEVVSNESTLDAKAKPRLAVDNNGCIHVVWCEYDSANRIFYTRKAFGGDWIAAEMISNISSSLSFRPEIEVDKQGFVHVVWFDELDYNGAGSDLDIFYRCWNATSASWMTTEVVSTESTDYSGVPDVSVDSKGNVHVVWYDLTNYNASGTDEDIFYKCRNGTSGNWTTTEVVSTESSSMAWHPRMAIDIFGNIHVVWQDSTDFHGANTDVDIFYKCLNAKTGSWTATEVVSTGSSEASLRLEFVVDNTVDNITKAHIVWQDATNYNAAGLDADIFLLSSTVAIEPPILYPISPDPDTDGIIELDWSDLPTATKYYVYRSNSPITSVEGLIPIELVSKSIYNDTVKTNGTYYYAVTAGTYSINSSASNCRNVTVAIPPEPGGIPGFELLYLLIGLLALIYIVQRRSLCRTTS